MLDAGLSLPEAFWTGAAFAGVFALLRIPASSVRSVLGRRGAFALGAGVVSVSSLAFGAAGAAGAGAWVFAWLSALSAAGCALHYGVLESWSEDALRESGNPFPIEGIRADRFFYASGAVLIGAAAGGCAATLHMSLPYFIRAAILAAAAVLAWRGMNATEGERPGGSFSGFRERLRGDYRAALFFGWRETQARFLALASFFQGLFLSWCCFAWQPHLTGLLGEDAPWIAGWVAAALSTAFLFGHAALGRVSAHYGRRTTALIYTGAVLGVSAAGAGAATGFPAGLIFIALVFSAAGAYGTVSRAFLLDVVSVEYREAAFAMLHTVSAAGAAAGMLVLGGVSRGGALDFAFAFGGFAALAAVPVLLILRRLEPKGDRAGEGDGRETVSEADFFLRP